MVRQLTVWLLSAAILRFTLAVTLAVSCANSWAATFDFVESTSDVVLARLQTDGADPFDHSNLTDLTFTTAGNALFGFGVGSYGGMFDSTFAANRWTSDGAGGLTTVDPLVSGIFSDETPPPSTVFPNATTPIFSLRLEPTLIGQMVLVDGTLPDFIEVQGTWRRVPEPSSIALVALGLFLLRHHRQGRRQD